MPCHVSAGARFRRAVLARCQTGVRPLLLLLVLHACADPRSAPQAHAATAMDSALVPATGRDYPLPPVLPTSSLPMVSPGDVVATRAYVGRQVRVTGRCLPPHDSHPLGPAVGAMEVWQLEWEGVAVYVLGRAPGTCTTPRARVDTVTITATVAEDTLPAIGDLPPAPRRYLMSAGKPPQR